jgi:hypothetical protein
MWANWKHADLLVAMRDTSRCRNLPTCWDGNWREWRRLSGIASELCHLRFQASGRSLRRTLQSTPPEAWVLLKRLIQLIPHLILHLVQFRNFRLISARSKPGVRGQIAMASALHLRLLLYPFYNAGQARRWTKCGIKCRTNSRPANCPRLQTAYFAKYAAGRTITSHGSFALLSNDVQTPDHANRSVTVYSERRAGKTSGLG